MRIKTAEIITVGREFLNEGRPASGAAYISGKMAATGITQHRQTVVAGDEDELYNAISDALARVDLIVVTGDELTFPTFAAKVVAHVAGTTSEISEQVVQAKKAYYKSRGRSLPEDARENSHIPRGAGIFTSENSPSYSFIIQRPDMNKAILVIPGTTGAVMQLWHERIRTFAENNSVGTVCSGTVNLTGCGIDEAKKEAERVHEKYSGVITAAFAGAGECCIRLFIVGDNRKETEALYAQAEAAVLNGSLAGHVYGVNTSMPAEIVRRLSERGESVTFAESCTGGLIAKMITDVPGSSAVFRGSIVSYSNSVKSRFLGVRGSTLEHYGAVSHQCALQMAQGARKMLNSDYAISVTGIAGPDGGSEEKPVGLVYIGFSSKLKSTVVKFYIEGSRETVRETSAQYAYRQLLKELMHPGGIEE